MYKSLDWLGFHLGQDGITPESDKLEKIREMEAPSTVKEIRQVVGLFSFFRIFIQNFSEFSRHLSALTRQNSTWRGGILPDKALECFKHLKSAPLGAKTLNNPDPEKHYYIHADASSGTKDVSAMIGWCLMQRIDNNRSFVPIGFGSRCLNENEQDLAINYMEALAMVEAYADFYILIQGKGPTIYCDNT